MSFIIYVFNVINVSIILFSDEFGMLSDPWIMVVKVIIIKAIIINLILNFNLIVLYLYDLILTSRVTISYHRLI